jgi:murein DD-endopeptidase MepM/ murein hydrolase activator NlpD
MIVIGMALALGMQAAQPQTAARPRIVFEEPQPARPVEGEVEAILIGPLFRTPFACVEHYFGQMPTAGDELGTDCMPVGGIEERGFAGFYRTDGRTNADWYGWGADVLSPIDGTVVGIFPNNRVNEPGTLGRPPAGMLQLRRADGVTVLLGHVSDVSVAIGDRVSAGQAVAKVGNNGPSRVPHIHIGLHRNNVPLQIRWDQRAMGRLQAQEGEGQRP